MSSPANPPIRAQTTDLARIDTQYRRYLVRRWFNLVWRSSIHTGLIVALGTSLVARSYRAIIPGFIAGFLMFSIPVYQLLSARRDLIRDPKPSTISSSVLTLATSTIISHSRLLLTYFLSGAGIAVGYCLAVEWSNPQREFGLRTPTPRHPLHLNERFIFLVLGNALTLLLWGVKDVLRGKVGPAWPKRRTRLPLAAQQAFTSSLPTTDDLLAVFYDFTNNPPWSFAYGTLSYLLNWPFVYSALYFLVRGVVWRTSLYALSSAVRPFIINFTKPARVNVGWTMVIHFALLELTSYLLLKAPISVLNVYTTHPLDFSVLYTSKTTLSPNGYLLTALQSQKPYNLHFTLLELLRVVNIPERRNLLFSDMSQTPQTHQLIQQLLLHLGQSYQTLITRGGTRSLTSSTPIRSQPDSHTITAKQADIFRQPIKRKSTYGLNLLDGPITDAPPVLLVKAQDLEKKVEVKAIEGVQRIGEKVVGQIEGVEVGKKVLVGTRGVVGDIYAWKGREWGRRNVERSIPGLERIKWILDILATLAVASIEEDTYGHVQLVLPAVLEAVVTLRSGLIAFERELLGQATLLGRAQDPATEEAKQLLEPLITACESSIRRIGEGYGKSMEAFRFPGSVAVVLDEICRS